MIAVLCLVTVAAAASSSDASFPPWLPPWLQWLDRMIMAFKPIAERYNFFVEFFNNLLGIATQSSEVLAHVMVSVTGAVLWVIQKLVEGKKKE